ncbi:MAG TPA: enoyl-CoA hydratase-related protein [Sporichthyaceae bacterium]|jgi:2-(1,2-epoxy-1,2-dihydrophenyl)acetyl-CoA isomerase|nr:enoyl-CoA hydratase-related protein [Sporichthyaceae bacterium]
MTEYRTVKVDHADGVAHILLNRPEALNAWTAEFGGELLVAMQEASADPAVRAILISGSGKGFSSGADLKAGRPTRADGLPDLSSRLRDTFNPVIIAIRDAPKPVIAAVHGAAAGLGCSLALACDLVVAGESSYFLLAFVNIGLIPDGGGLRFLAERVGLIRAAELAMLGERLPAPKALDWGLVNSVHPDAELLDAATALCRRLAAGPTVAIANIKRTLRETTQANLVDQVWIEAVRQQEHAGTHDFAEGVAAFVEKRPAKFRGN